MNATDFLAFMGHSSIYPPFDEFLTNIGVATRPSIKRNLNMQFFIPNKGLSLSFKFDISANDEGFLVKSTGVFIFSGFEVVLILEDKKNGRYEGSLPNGLVVSDTRESVEQKLGSPKRRNVDSDNYYLNELVWMVGFRDSKLEIIQFSLPTNSSRKHGISPAVSGA